MLQMMPFPNHHDLGYSTDNSHQVRSQIFGNFVASFSPIPICDLPTPPSSHGVKQSARVQTSMLPPPRPGAHQPKAGRATQACDNCRTKKAKCDEGWPVCSHCKKYNLICVYKEVAPRKQDEQTQTLLNLMEKLEDNWINRIESLEKIQLDQKPGFEQLLGRKPNETTRALGNRTSVSALLPESSWKIDAPSMQTMQPSQPDILDDQNPFFGQPPQPALNLNTSLDDENDNAGELSIPVGHTTAAHRLLMWPSIQRLFHNNHYQYDEGYVMTLEQERGLISVYGEGEISSTADGSQLPPPPILRDGGGFDETRMIGDPNIQTGATADPSGVDIDSFGRLSLDAETARRYYHTYLKKIHQLHPFLDTLELDKKVETFIRLYCPPENSPFQPNRNICHGNWRPMKRERSQDDFQGIRGESGDAAAASVRPPVGRNIHTAMILLLFALGAICETQSPLPEPIMDRPHYLSQNIPKALPPLGICAPVVESACVPYEDPSLATLNPALPMSASFYNSRLPSASHSSNPYLRAQNDRPERTSPATKPEYGQGKNLEIIPGLALYGYASTILGLLQGGVDLEHAQAALLAGLYAGQLAHPFQSHGWISQASGVCQVLVRRQRYEPLDEDKPLKELYKFAFWTCLQLESDLLEDLDLLASNIFAHEARIDLPKGIHVLQSARGRAPAMSMMMFYSAQVYLRKILNRVHTNLYKVDKQGQTRWSPDEQVALRDYLDCWRSSLPAEISWNDKEPPARDINAARLRAEYYRARHIIYRPLLYHALHYAQPGAQTSADFPTGSANISQAQQLTLSTARAGQQVRGRSRIMDNIGNLPTESSSAQNWTPELRHACKVCIESAILSTEAFDGMPGRLIVTNIFGTAHAQFGNMLVLSATYMSSLSELVERSTLERLLERTIRFLLRNGNVSPALRADAKILTKIYRNIFGYNPVIT